MFTCTQEKLIFDHLVELPHCECVFCAAHEESTSRKRIYLIFRQQKKIYQRFGLKACWEEVTSADEYANIWEGFEQAVNGRQIPTFVSEIPELITSH